MNYKLLASSLVLSCLLACATSGHAEQEILLSSERATTEPASSEATSQPLIDQLKQDQRIVAIGDIHGDYKQFVRVMKSAGLVNAKLNWAGGDTHFVQLGDIPDRGPDSRQVMDLLIALQAQAAEQGGAVTVLIGNHDAMMMIGDLRYVHPNEYAAFKDKLSKQRRDNYYSQVVAHLKATLAQDELPKFNVAYRREWNSKHPLGYVEHRQAWAPTGKYGKWVLSRPAVAKVGDVLFVHGGLSPEFSTMSIAEINTRVRTELAKGEQAALDTILEDENGPLWDRGWVRRAQTPDNAQALDQVLASYQANRMVVAHTPLTPIIVPRFGGKLLMADVGLSKPYGHGQAALEIVGQTATMMLGDERLVLPNSDSEMDAYFDAAEKLLKNPKKVVRYRELVTQALESAAEAAAQENNATQQATAAEN